MARRLRLMILVLLHCLQFLSSAQSIQAPNFFPPRFRRFEWHSSYASKEWLFIDSGEVYTGHSPKYHGYVSPKYFWQGSTLAIDLTRSWDNRSFSVIPSNKPVDYPYARNPALWYDKKQDILYSFGGWAYTEANCFGSGCYNRTWWADGDSTTVKATVDNQDKSLWMLKSPTSGTNSWERSSSQPPPDISSGVGAARTGDENVFFKFGGGRGWVPGSSNIDIFPGIGMLDISTGEWTNKSLAGYGPAGFTASNQAVYFKNYGEKGVIVSLGGFTATSKHFNWGFGEGGFVPMTNITIYDVASAKLFYQTTSGNAPPTGRWLFCAVGVQDAHDPTKSDIFIHGGLSGSQNDQPDSPQLSDVYALSFPSFVWTQIPNSLQQQRAFHTCEVIGNRQMIVIGGDNPQLDHKGSSDDPWSNGLGIFDMAALQWTSGYDHTAAPYARSNLLREASSADPYPSWNDPELEQIFNKTAGNGQGSSNTNSGGSNGSINVGAIVGGIIGGIALVVIIVLTIFLYRRKQKQKEHAYPATTTNDKARPDGFYAPQQAELDTPSQTAFSGRTIHEKRPGNFTPLAQEVEDTSSDRRGPTHELGSDQLRSPIEIGSSQVRARQEIEASMSAR